MLQLDFNNLNLNFSGKGTYLLQARKINPHLLSNIPTLYVVERFPYVLRDISTSKLYGFGVQKDDLIYGEVESEDYKDAIWIDDWSSGTRIPYTKLLFIEDGDIQFQSADLTKYYPDRFSNCFLLENQDGERFRLIAINNDLYLVNEKVLKITE